jgi:DNA-binding NarL/FixJ family response regulator
MPIATPMPTTASAPTEMPAPTEDSRQRDAGDGRAIGTAARPIRVQVVDDHQAVRRGLVELLEDQPDMQVTGVSATATAAIAQAGCGQIDVAVLDYHLGGRNGLWLSRKLRLLSRAPRVVIYSAYANDHLAASCAVANVDAVLNKGGLGSELCDAIRAVARGRRLLPRVPRPLADTLSRRLTDAEQPIFGMLLSGIAREEICQILRISPAELASRETTMLNRLEALPGELPGEIDDRRLGGGRIDPKRLIPQPRADVGLSM